MSPAWIANIKRNRDAIDKAREDLEDRYTLLANETDTYNEMMQAAVEALERAVSYMDEAMKEVETE